MPFDPDRPYNDLPLFPPKAELETKAVLRKAIAANKALAELKGAGDLIPNQGVLINAIVLQEAKLSSEIGDIAPKQGTWLGRRMIKCFFDAASCRPSRLRQSVSQAVAEMRGTLPMGANVLVRGREVVQN